MINVELPKYTMLSRVYAKNVNDMVVYGQIIGITHCWVDPENNFSTWEYAIEVSPNERLTIVFESDILG